MEHSASGKAIAYCLDCGPATVPHWIERLSARMDHAIGYVTKPPELIWRGAAPFIALLRPGRAMPLSAAILSAIGIGRILTTPDEKVNWRTRVLWEEAARRGIDMKELRLFGMPRELFFASYGGDTRAFDGVPRPRGAQNASLDWMDDKGIILGRFKKAGVPVPRGKSCRTQKEAENVLRAVGGPVIVKPNLGSRSRHTYVHLTDAEALRQAFRKAKELSPWVVVEEELSGFVFRVTLVAGRVAGVMRREPPHVMGDGKHTLRELVALENKNPLRRGPIFHELQLNDDARAILKEQGLSETSVPQKGRVAMLHPKVSRSYGASTTEITDIHPDNEKLFLHIAAVLNDPLVGVDFMAEDMARSWRDQKCGVIECNSLPFIDLHHFPLKGPARNVAGMVWDMTFPASRRK